MIIYRGICIIGVPLFMIEAGEGVETDRLFGSFPSPKGGVLKSILWVCAATSRDPMCRHKELYNPL